MCLPSKQGRPRSTPAVEALLGDERGGQVFGAVHELVRSKGHQRLSRKRAPGYPNRTHPCAARRLYIKWRVAHIRGIVRRGPQHLEGVE